MQRSLGIRLYKSGDKLFPSTISDSKMTPVSIITITLLVSGSSAFWFTPHASLSQCEKRGLVCSEDCRTVEYCPDAKQPSTTIRECPSGTFCSLETGVPECDAKSCPTAKPTCSGGGIFPSLADCHIYFLCSAPRDPNPVTISCGNEVFNTVTSLCDANTKCRTPVQCPKAGDNGFVDPDTKVFCYYCTEVNTPYVYRC